jgi:hypothetical protein
MAKGAHGGNRGDPRRPCPRQQHGFTLVDFTSDKMVLRFFKWDAKTQPVEALDALQPFHTAELARPI